MAYLGTENRLQMSFSSLEELLEIENSVSLLMALIIKVYNIKRSINILGIENLLAKLQNWKPDYAKASKLWLKRSILKLSAISKIEVLKIAA